jgi:deoxyribose-phosphate aldolase
MKEVFLMNIASMIDHTLLKPEATSTQIEKLCQEALTFEFASVCVNPMYVKLAAKMLKNSPVKVCTVIGFPLGATLSKAKAQEARLALELGAEELDMVMAIGAAKSGQLSYVEQDIAEVCAVAGNAIVKVILETCLLTNEEIVEACLCAKRAGAHFVKTSTGFSTAGATIEHITLMRKTVGPDFGVKASGGIRTFDDAQNMIAAGATRIGASAGPKILSSVTTKENS